MGGMRTTCLASSHQQNVIKMKFMHVAFACVSSRARGPGGRVSYSWAKTPSSLAADTAANGSVSPWDRSSWPHGTWSTTGRVEQRWTMHS